MKNKVLAGMVAVAIASVAVMNMDLGFRKQENLSAVQLDNIEALAQGESGEVIPDVLLGEAIVPYTIEVS